MLISINLNVVPSNQTIKMTMQVIAFGITVPKTDMYCRVAEGWGKYNISQHLDKPSN